VSGAPLACLVAFMDSLGMHVGWSLRNNSKRPAVQTVRGEVIKWRNTETAPYTKMHGVRIAAFRALTDKIHIETERVYRTQTAGTTQRSEQFKKRFIYFDNSGKRIHSTVANNLPEFIGRCQRWFKQNNGETPINVSYMETIKNIEQKYQITTVS